MKKIYFVIGFIFFATAVIAQKRDTVVVDLGKSSKITFTMEDRDDLEILKHYNFNQLFADMFRKLEEKERQRSSGADSADSVTVAEEENKWSENGDKDDDDEVNDEDDDDQDDNDNDSEFEKKWKHGKRYHRDGTWQTFSFDLGTNNYLGSNGFPDDSNPYAVRPWGSWYVGMSSVQRARLAKKFFLEWGLGVSWYNFKFEQDNITMSKDETGVIFTPDTRDADFVKSKLTASYVMTSLVPVIDFNDHGKKSRFWDGEKESFRFGVGPYAAYRIGSHSKVVYEDKDKIRDKDYDSYYLSNFRYGIRVQAGYRSTDLFFNYDLNELFTSGKGPKVNAISFGVIF